VVIERDIVLIMVGAAISLVASIITEDRRHRWELSRDEAKAERERKQKLQEEWRERKNDSYRNIMKPLTELDYTLGEYYAAWTHASPPLNEERQRQLSALFAQATTALKIAAAEGAYSVSEDTAAALRTLVSALEMRYGGDVVDLVEEHVQAVQRALGVVRQEAKSDLSQ
jgi:hypothetical protein